MFARWYHLRQSSARRRNGNQSRIRILRSCSWDQSGYKGFKWRCSDIWFGRWRTSILDQNRYGNRTRQRCYFWNIRCTGENVGYFDLEHHYIWGRYLLLSMRVSCKHVWQDHCWRRYTTPMKTKLLIVYTLFNILFKVSFYSLYSYLYNTLFQVEPTTTTKMTTREVQETSKGQKDERTRSKGSSINVGHLVSSISIAAVFSRAAMIAKNI